MRTITYVRRPFYVEAVKVTAENMGEVAMWCKGEILLTNGQTAYIKVDVQRVVKDKQTMAFVGDYVLKMGRGFKVYNKTAMEQNFEICEEMACGDVVNTSNHQPCVLGAGHKNGKTKIGCRSFADYKTINALAIDMNTTLHENAKEN